EVQLCNSLYPKSLSQKSQQISINILTIIFCKTSLLLENLAFAKTLIANALVALMQEDRRQTFFTAIESLVFAKALMVNSSPYFQLCIEKGNIYSYTTKRQRHLFQ